MIEGVSPETAQLVATPADFEEFYRREWSRVVALVYGLSGRRWAAEDIAQDVFLKAHRRWDRVGRYDHPGAWVRKVAVNMAMSRFRRAKAEARALRRWVGFQPTLFPELEHVSEDFWDRVRALPRRQAQVVALHYVEDLAVREIAELLGVAESTVKTSLQKGRATLARHLEAGEGAQR